MTMKTETAVAKQEQENVRNNPVRDIELTPAADIYESKEGATVYVDLPGVSKDSLDINIDKNVLTIKGSIKLNTPDTLKPTYTDINAGSYTRQFTLSSEMDAEKIEASLNNGELKLFIPRSEAHKPRKIEVKAA